MADDLTLLNTEQVSKVFPMVPYQWLVQMRHDGAGPPYIKLGRKVCYLEKDVADWIMSNRVEPSKQSA